MTGVTSCCARTRPGPTRLGSWRSPGRLCLFRDIFGLRPHRHWPIGLHGALLPRVMVAMGAVFAAWGGFLTVSTYGITWFQAIGVPYWLILPWFVAAVVVYYLVWKYVVGFLNQVLGIA